MIIFMDGELDDYESVYDELVLASEFPITYMIVGIGNYDFQNFVKNFESSRTDENPNTVTAPPVIIYSKNLKKKAIRDNIQFFQYRDFKENDSSGIENLAQECLRKLPNHFLNYYRDLKDKRPPFSRKDIFQATQDFMTK